MKFLSCFARKKSNKNTSLSSLNSIFTAELFKNSQHGQQNSPKISAPKLIDPALLEKISPKFKLEPVGLTLESHRSSSSKNYLRPRQKLNHLWEKIKQKNNPNVPPKIFSPRNLQPQLSQIFISRRVKLRHKFRQKRQNFSQKFRSKTKNKASVRRKSIVISNPILNFSSIEARNQSQTQISFCQNCGQNQTFSMAHSNFGVSNSTTLNRKLSRSENFLNLVQKHESFCSPQVAKPLMKDAATSFSDQNLSEKSSKSETSMSKTTTCSITEVTKMTPVPPARPDFKSPFLPQWQPKIPNFEPTPEPNSRSNFKQPTRIIKKPVFSPIVTYTPKINRMVDLTPQNQGQTSSANKSFSKIKKWLAENDFQTSETESCDVLNDEKFNDFISDIDKMMESSDTEGGNSEHSYSQKSESPKKSENSPFLEKIPREKLKNLAIHNSKSPNGIKKPQKFRALKRNDSAVSEIAKKFENLHVASTDTTHEHTPQKRKVIHQTKNNKIQNSFSKFQEKWRQFDAVNQKNGDSESQFQGKRVLSPRQRADVRSKTTCLDPMLERFNLMQNLSRCEDYINRSLCC